MELFVNLSLYGLIGIVAGILSGLYGIGGGMIVVPALFLMFISHLDPNFSFSHDVAMRLAVGTSLAVMVGTSLTGVLSHQKLRSIDWALFRRFSPGMVAGSFVGAVVAHYLHADIIRNAFGLFLIIIALRTLFVKHKVAAEASIPKNNMLFSIASLVGVLSVLLGIGAGSICVPYFMSCGIPLRRTAGTASVCSLLAAVLGTAGFLFAGVGNQTDALPWTTGYIYWPAFLGVGLMSVIFVTVGARLSQVLPNRILRPMFGVLLLGIGVRMIF